MPKCCYQQRWAITSCHLCLCQPASALCPYKTVRRINVRPTYRPMDLVQMANPLKYSVMFQQNREMKKLLSLMIFDAGYARAFCEFWCVLHFVDTNKCLYFNCYNLFYWLYHFHNKDTTYKLINRFRCGNIVKKSSPSAIGLTGPGISLVLKALFIVTFRSWPQVAIREP